MASYIVYTYQFSPIKISEKLYDTLPTDEERMKLKQIYLDQILDNPNFAFKKSKTKKYNHKIISKFESGIFCFKLANSKTVNLENNFSIQPYDYAPSCKIIIDNRTNCQHILIEDDHKSFSNPDLVRNIIQYTFNHYLEPNGLSVKIEKEYQPSEFWDFIKEYPEISMVRFDLSYPNLPRVSEKIDELIRISSKNTNSKKTRIEYNSSANETLTLKENDQQLYGLVQASATTGNKITVRVKGVKKQEKIGYNAKSVEIDEIEMTKDSTLFDDNKLMEDLLNALLQ